MPSVVTVITVAEVLSLSRFDFSFVGRREGLNEFYWQKWFLEIVRVLI